MSNIVANLLKLFFGTKAEKDKKEVMPYIEKIKAIYPQIEQLSNDELRARSAALKKTVQDAIASDEKRIADLKIEMERADISIETKEKISKEIDDIVKHIDQTIEKVLLELLPEAFAIIKDTARRFKENETIEVTASDFDRDLSVKKDYVQIEGDKAIFKNSWVAGGNLIT